MHFFIYFIVSTFGSRYVLTTSYTKNNITTRQSMGKNREGNLDSGDKTRNYTSLLPDTLDASMEMRVSRIPSSSMKTFFANQFSLFVIKFRILLGILVIF